MAILSSILAWRIPWTKEPGGLPQGCKESDTTEATQHAHTYTLMPSTENRHLILKRLMAFRQGFLKLSLGVRVARCVINSWTFFWLVGSEVSGDVSEILIISLLVSASLGSVYLWSACIHYPPSAWGLSFCKITQSYVSGY